MSTGSSMTIDNTNNPHNNAEYQLSNDSDNKNTTGNCTNNIDVNDVTNIHIDNSNIDIITDGNFHDTDSNYGMDIDNDNPDKTRLSIRAERIKKIISVDVVGVDSKTNGRCCNQHDICGRSLRIGDILFTEWSMQRAIDLDCDDLLQPIDNLEEVVKVYKVDEDGIARCHVGYLKKRLFYPFGGADQFDSLYLRLLVDYRRSVNEYERSRSQQSLGICNCAIVRDDTSFDGTNALDANTPCNMKDALSYQQVLLRSVQDTALPPPHAHKKGNGKQKTKKTKQKTKKNKSGKAKRAALPTNTDVTTDSNNNNVSETQFH